MKIIIAVHHFPPHRTAGAELEAFRTAKTLLGRGHDVEVICVESITAEVPAETPTEETGHITWRDDEYQGLMVRRLSFNIAAAPNPDRWEYDNLWIGEHLAQYLQARKPDLLHLFSGYLMTGRTLLVAKELGIPTVVSLMDFWFLCRRFTLLRTDGTLSTLPINPATCARCIAEEQRLPRLLGRVVPILMNEYWQTRTDKVQEMARRIDFCLDALNSANLIICRSHFLESVYTQAGADPTKMVFCRQGFAGSVSHPKQTASSTISIEDQPLRVIYLGQISQHKGVHTLIEAVRQLPTTDIELDVYGDLEKAPSYVAKLKKLAANDPRIQLQGLVQPDAISALLQQADVLVVPSIWYENSPNTIAEAFAHGVPVIASNLGGMAELIQHEGNGLLFTAGDAESLATQLRRLRDTPTLLSKLQQGIQPFKSVDEEIDEIEGYYAAVLRQTAGIEISDINLHLAQAA